MQTDKTVDRESLEKLYVQMYSIIKAKIESREWPAGSQIPTEDELCQAYDVSKATVRMAIAELVRHGYLKKQQAAKKEERGTPSATSPSAIVSGFLDKKLKEREEAKQKEEICQQELLTTLGKLISEQRNCSGQVHLISKGDLVAGFQLKQEGFGDLETQHALDILIQSEKIFALHHFGPFWLLPLELACRFR